MKVHHLNCATLCPAGGFLISGNLFKKPEMVCHCLLIESNDGLILVDTGLGIKTLKYPYGELGPGFLLTSNPILQINETAIKQIQKLGFKAEDVRHIILTHLDIDHAGGLSDFPNAAVHIYDKEYEIAIAKNKNLNESLRYNPFQWTHGPDWKIHTSSESTDSWMGFEQVQQAHGLPPEILLIPLIGHTKGHCGIAVSTEKGWLFHAGDAYFHHTQMEKKSTCPILLDFQQISLSDNNDARLKNIAKLKNLANNKETNINVFCSHDKYEFDKF